MRKTPLLVMLLLLLLPLAGCWFGESDYVKQNKTFAKQAFGDRLPDYTWLNTPGSGNAAGTVRELPCSRPFAECWLLASTATYFEDNVSTDDRKKWLGRIAAPVHEGSVQLTKALATHVKLDAVAPDIQKTLSANAGIDLSKATNVDLGAKSIDETEINALELKAAIDAKVLRQPVVDVLRSQKYRVVQGDIRYTGYKIDVDTKANDGLNAALKATELAGKIVGQDAGLNLSVTHTSDTHFILTNDEPVVIGYLVSDAIPDIHLSATSAVRFPKLQPSKPSKADRESLQKVFALHTANKK